MHPNSDKESKRMFNRSDTSIFPSKDNRHTISAILNTKEKSLIKRKCKDININLRLKWKNKKDKKDKKNKETTKIKVTKRDPDFDDDFDTYVFMLRGDDDDIIMNDLFTNDGMMEWWILTGAKP